MQWALLALVTLVSFLMCLLLASQAKKLELLAQPGAHRQHQMATPMVGGLAIYCGLLTGFFLIDHSFRLLLPSLFLMCVVGALDDRYSLPSWSRFLAQGIAAYLMIRLTGVQLHSLGNLVSNEAVSLSQWSVPLTIFAVIGVINAINMSDGLDGLAGGLVLLVLLALLFKAQVEPTLILITVGSLIGFLMLNLRIGRPYAKVFMGDAGSTMLGLILAYLLIKASQSDNGFAPVQALWLLALPLIDAVAVLLVRPLSGTSPFSADRIHYHHQLVDAGLGVNQALLTALVLQCIAIGAAIAFTFLGIAEAIQFWAFLGLFVAYFTFLLRRVSR